MKNVFAVFALFGIIACDGALAAGANSVRGVYSQNNVTTGLRGNQGLAQAYKTNQLNTYYMVTQPDVDSACRTRIFNCLSDYCGDVTVLPGQRTGRCQYATESELYNYAMLCLQKDNSVLLPQYSVNGQYSANAMNTAARLCPSYVQQEVMSYLSMANMAEQLSKSHSDLCLQRRQELEAAMSCHSVALAYGNETASMLTSQLTDYCGAGVPGGSVEMVTRFANAGNVGANIWGWAEKVVSLNLNKKGADWQAAVDSVLAGYTNRMNLACGDNMQINTSSYAGASSSEPTALQTAAALVTGVMFPSDSTEKENPNEAWSVYMEVPTMSEMWDYNTAYQVVQAAMSNVATTQNAFLTSAQIDSMQDAYIRGTKVFIMRDSGRCYIIPVRTMTGDESSLVSQSFANCISK